MGSINYTITSGTLPITVELMDGATVVDTNVHSEYGSYSFTEITFSIYDVYFEDAQGCNETITNVTGCDNCPDGYDITIDGCLFNDVIPSVETEVTYDLIARSFYVYSEFGTLLFSDYNIDGTGNYTRINTSYWKNLSNTYIGGPLNRSGVWTSIYHNFQNISFSYCIDVALEKTYYIGVGSDNYSFIKLNGTTLILQDRDALADMLGSPHTESGFQIMHKFWWIYPITIPAGSNILEIGGHNIFLIAAVGVQIYDNTYNDILVAASDNDLNIIFNTKDLVGLTANYEYSPSNGYHGYECPEGYILDCANPPNCVQRTFIPCGTTTSSSSTTSTTTTTTTNL